MHIQHVHILFHAHLPDILFAVVSCIVDENADRSVRFDDSTGKLTGEMRVDSYFLYGLDKPYEAPYIPAVPHGTNNLFGTTN